MINTFKPQKLILEITRCLFICLFVYASISKILDHENFKIQLGQSPVLTAYADWLVWILPTLELLISGLLFFTKTIVWGFYFSYSMMIMFTMYILIVLNFSDFIPCSCGGVLEELSWNEHILFNLVFVAFSLISISILEKPNHLNYLKK